MIPLAARRGWLVPLLLFAVLLALMVSTPVGVARGDAATGSAGVLAQEASFTVNARDLGLFAADPPAIDSPSAILVNMNTGKVLYERKAHLRRPMASTTKIMTAILIFENMDLATPVTVSQKAAATVEPKVWLREGDVLTVEELLYALLVRSANSAAVALAEACAGSVEAFVSLMNEKAALLGMKDTHFVNPNGLDAAGQYSTASDMAVVGCYAMKEERLRKIVGTETYSLSLDGRAAPIVFENTNKLLQQASWVTGIKTGLTPKADQCLVASGTRDGVSVVSVILGQPSSNVCWRESKALLEYGFAQYRHLAFLREGAVVAEAAAPYELDGRVQLVTDGAVEIDLYKDDEVTTSISVDRPLVLPVTTGETFGRVVMTVGGQPVGSVDLVATRSVDKATLGEKLTYYWDRFARWLGRVI